MRAVVPVRATTAVRPSLPRGVPAEPTGKPTISPSLQRPMVIACSPLKRSVAAEQARTRRPASSATARKTCSRAGSEATSGGTRRGGVGQARGARLLLGQPQQRAGGVLLLRDVDARRDEVRHAAARGVPQRP